jgi:DNA-binding MarR family transcriptional regulator
MTCFCAQSRRLARLLTARYDAALAPAGLSAAQFETLSTLRGMGTPAGTALAARLAVDKTTLSRNLRPLLQDGLVASAISTTDARSLTYSLTEAGRKRLAKAKPLWETAHHDTTTTLGTHAPAIMRSLERITQSLR